MLQVGDSNILFELFQPNTILISIYNSYNTYSFSICEYLVFTSVNALEA